MGQRGRGDRGLDRHGPHHRRQGRAPPARHRGPLQHHPGRRRDRIRRGGRPPAVSRRRVRARGGAARRASRVPPGPRRILNRAIVIHGHFYQPPRENPWLDSVEVQDSAAPHHDWNERVTAECYAPNTAARRVDDKNRVLDIVNSFEKISFNVGPTLISWLERHRPDVYEKILEADRQSVAARGGHGNALAQVYNHMIMPLATRRDKVTQVRWAIEDFRARFGREPEGLWLPETAVDDETLEVLAEADVKFTILAPSQARRVRPLGAEAWEDVGDGIDPSRAYRWRSARGLGLAVFFYDGPISRGIAFERLLERGEHLVAWLNAAFSDGRDWPQLVHCATDGESYGHHFRFGEMALAAAVQQIDAEDAATLTNYGAFLAANPPTHEVEIRPRTSWSCAHGIERWRSDCGCRTRADWHQRWRAPLREALDWLRDQIDPFFEARASSYLKDPWAARDAYVAILLDRGPERLDAFFAAHARAPLDDAARVEARRLLEMQRNRLLMYTSCGWFFDEISGLEAVQILRYAAMALQYLDELGGSRLEDEFVRRLAAAPSNLPEWRDGAEVYRRVVRPTVVDIGRVVAHYAITGFLEEYEADARVYAYRVRRLDEAREASDGTALRLARVRVHSEVTGETHDAVYALLHFGGHDFSCGIGAWRDQAAYDALKADLLGRFARSSVADLVRGLEEYFPGELCSLSHLFLEERRRVLTSVIRALLETHEETYRRIWEENRRLMHYLREVDAPIPDALALAARHVLERQASDGLERLSDLGEIPERVFAVVDEARQLGLALDLSPKRFLMHHAVVAAIEAIAAAPTGQRVARAVALIEGARRLDVRYGHWVTQNRFFQLWREHPDARRVLLPLAETLAFNLEA
ncbi:MAG: glycoside hydrolase [Candidatus Rokuibacteriota bacterium]|nr:MAG: glycoside hydrolase [Candidatus Rokubacteria bacterium]